MKKYIIFIFIILITGAIHPVDWEQLQIKVIESAEKEGKTLLKLQDKNNNIFGVHYSAEPDGKTIKILLYYKDIFFGWSGIKIRQLKFVITAGELDILVMPKSFSCGNNDVISHIPAGVFFQYTDSLEYNFRIVINQIFIRIKGIYTAKNEMCDKILKAIKNPRAYIRSRDTEFLFIKLKALEKDLEKLKLREYRLKKAIIALHNHGFFQGPQPLNEKLINRVIEIKKKDNSLSIAQIRSRIEREGISASSGDIELILGLFFNIFK